MLQLKNTTPFQANMAVFPNEDGIDTLFTVVKATFDLGLNGDIAEEQVPVCLADEYWGEPGLSSLKYPSEAHLTKPGTDILLIGEACHPQYRRITQLDVTLAVGKLRKTVRVFGDRVWEKGVVGWQMSEPLPFETMPLHYERAFGGIHEVDREKKEVLFEARNPVGCGFVGKRKKEEIVGMKLPNLEDPKHLIEKLKHLPPPAGFGAIAPAWEPRKSFAGTYNDSWLKNRAPYLPPDFNPKFFNLAHPDLVCPGYLKGGEPIEVLNAATQGTLRFALPICRLEATVRVAGKDHKPPLNLETVIIEPSVSRLCLTWRAALPCDKQVQKVEQVEITLQEIVSQRTAA